MMKRGKWVAYLWIVSFPLVALPAGDQEAGRNKSEKCAACHQADGNSTVPQWPKLAGQYRHYLEKQLLDFRMGEQGPRFEASMFAMVASLTDQDIADLSTFYAQQTPDEGGKADQATVALGERLYRGGDLASGVTACAACHGPSGQGNAPGGFPKLAGQHKAYTEAQLLAFQGGKRHNSPHGIMESIARRMTPEQIAAVSSYIEGLRE